MSWRSSSTVEVRCPRCGTVVQVPVEIDHVDLCYDGSTKGTHTLRTFFVGQVNVNGHACVFTDGLMPVERFTKIGALDDTARSGVEQ